MRKVAWFSALCVFAVGACGCASGGDAAAPEDSAFQKSLADAAAKNGNKAPSAKGGMKKAPLAGAPANGTSAPASQ
jgi:hypothetical protein